MACPQFGRRRSSPPGARSTQAPMLSAIRRAWRWRNGSHPGHDFKCEKMSLSNRVFAIGHTKRRRRWTNLCLFRILTLGNRPPIPQKSVVTSGSGRSSSCSSRLLFCVGVAAAQRKRGCACGRRRRGGDGRASAGHRGHRHEGQHRRLSRRHRHGYAHVHRLHYLAGHRRNHGGALPRGADGSQGRSADRYRFPAL